MSKKCFKCKIIKPIEEFYRHKKMSDGRLNKCKTCTKNDVRDNRSNNIEYYRSYDRERGNRQGYEYVLEYRSKYPKIYKAHTMVSNALRRGHLRKMPCESCSTTENLHGHHDDYDYPLSVRWLCAVCHREWHEKNGEGLNSV